MRSPEMHKTQAFGYVIREQLKVTVLSLRPYIIIAGALAAVATFLAFADYFRGRGGVEFAPELSMIPAIAGVLLAIAIWQSERPFKSGFFWTVPVDRTTNAGAKIFAAWLCLMIAVTAFVLWLLILAFITKGNIRGDEVVHLLPSMTIPPRRTLDASMLRTIQWTPQPAFWLVPFTAATSAYAIVSALMLGLKHPFRLVFGAIAGAFLVAAVGQGIGADAFWEKLQGVTRPLMEGRYGIDAVLTARSESLHTRIDLADGTSIGVWRALPVVSDWVIATLLWTGLGIAGLLAALTRHRERR